MEDEKEEFVCKKCNRVCKNKGGLTKHQNICLKLEKGESFLKNDKFTKKARKTSHVNKVLPLSQPLKDTDEFDKALDKVRAIAGRDTMPDDTVFPR